MKKVKGVPMMLCPECGEKSHVYDCYAGKRYRKCCVCGHNFSTQEIESETLQSLIGQRDRLAGLIASIQQECDALQAGNKHV